MTLSTVEVLMQPCPILCLSLLERTESESGGVYSAQVLRAIEDLPLKLGDSLLFLPLSMLLP